MKILFVLIFAFTSVILSADVQYLIEGYIFNQETGEVIPGASLQILNKKYGTYSSASGHFRMPLPAGKHKIKVSSMGYKTQIIEISKVDKSVKIFLIPEDVEFQNVLVTGDINAENIIKRAIQRKEENIGMLKSFKGELYSKFVIEIAGSNMEFSSNESSMAVSTEIGSGNKASAQVGIMETFSDNYIDYENDKTRSIIKQRRQTSNIDPQSNIFVLSRFQSIYNDYFKLAETRIMNPLNDNAFSRYDFELVHKTKIDDKYIYKIGIQPTTKTFPAFEGTISILEESYNLVETDLTTSEYTSIPFVEYLNIYQKFEEIEDNIWHPVYLNISGDASASIIKGLAEFETRIKATSIYNNYEVNTEIPDSIFKMPGKISISQGADNYDMEYWENNSLRKLTDTEKEIYEELGSSQDKAADTSTSCSDRDYFTSLAPYLDFNRVTSILPGIAIGVKFLKDFKIETFSGYSFGQKEPVGSAKFTYNIFNNSNFNSEIYAGAFSEYNTLTSDKSINRYVNLVFAALYHDDYYDYYKNDGWKTGLNVSYKKLKTNLDFRLDNHFSLNKSTNSSILSNKKWRENPEIIEGRFMRFGLNAFLGEINHFYPGSEFNYEVGINAGYGKQNTGNIDFISAEIYSDILIPTFNTGYAPMMLRIKGKAGYSTEDTPIQYQYRMPTRLSIISGFGSMTTAPFALYGGTEYYELHTEFNLTDIWWRAMRLPMFQGRGIDLILAASSSKYNSSNPYSYLPTDNNYYSEVGFGLSRIPVFVSNVAYLKANFRWGLGPIAGGEFGWSVSLALPL